MKIEDKEVERKIKENECVSDFHILKSKEEEYYYIKLNEKEKDNKITKMTPLLINKGHLYHLKSKNQKIFVILTFKGHLYHLK